MLTLLSLHPMRVCARLMDYSLGVPVNSRYVGDDMYGSSRPSSNYYFSVIVFGSGNQQDNYGYSNYGYIRYNSEFKVIYRADNSQPMYVNDGHQYDARINYPYIPSTDQPYYSVFNPMDNPHYYLGGDDSSYYLSRNSPVVDYQIQNTHQTNGNYSNLMDSDPYPGGQSYESIQQSGYLGSGGSMHTLPRQRSPHCLP